MGFERTVADWRAVLDDPLVDAVSITLPNALHREVAVAAAQAGKHVWVEKPVGRGLEDTLAVAAAVREAGVLSAVGFCYRFAPAVAHARALIEDGAIGDVTHYRATFLADYASDPLTAASWRFRRADAGSGALGDLMAAQRRHDPLPRRPDRTLQRPHGDADRAAPRAAGGRRARTSRAADAASWWTSRTRTGRAR